MTKRFVSTRNCPNIVERFIIFFHPSKIRIKLENIIDFPPKRRLDLFNTEFSKEKKIFEIVFDLGLILPKLFFAKTIFKITNIVPLYVAA